MNKVIKVVIKVSQLRRAVMFPGMQVRAVNANTAEVYRVACSPCRREECTGLCPAHERAEAASRV